MTALNIRCFTGRYEEARALLLRAARLAEEGKSQGCACGNGAPHPLLWLWGHPGLFTPCQRSGVGPFEPPALTP